MSRSAPRAAFERRWLTLSVLCLSLLVITVDGTIVNVALPSLVRELGADTAQLQWIVDAYTLAFAGLLLLAGALGDRFGRHRALAAGLLVFGLGSVLAALASTPDQLIATRALMGVGAALVMPATLSIISTSDRPAASATAMTGRLTRKTELHAKCSSSQPPASPPPPAR